jgi:hypothetical protein
VLEEIWSASDHDVVVLARDLDGNLVDSDYVDVTTVSWIRPKIASHRAASQFLCVAQRAGVGTHADRRDHRHAAVSGGLIAAARP